MFSTDFLHIIREYEVSEIAKRLTPGVKVLELGAGTGYQAKWLEERGIEVVAVDVPQNQYKSARMAPVVEYDGHLLPFHDKQFDVVFSSHVLEHVSDARGLHRETARVLKPYGYCLHVMPSAAWRFWTAAANYVELLQRICTACPQLVPRRLTLKDLRHRAGVLLTMLRTIRAYAVPPRHGESGNALTELWSFSRRRWIRHFLDHDFVVLDAEPIRIFYTGHMVLGKRWPLRWRRYAARVLGSASVMYRVRPRAV